MKLRPALLLFALTACTRTVAPPSEDASAAHPVTSTPARGPDAPASAAPPVAAAPHVWTKVSAKSPLDAQVQAEIRKARALKLTPVAYGSAGWCKPCQAIKKYREDRLMRDALRGMYVIEIDVDDFDAAQLTALYKKLRGVPVFMAVGDDGKATGPQIDSGAWGDDVPENMAPKLKEFFAKL